MATHFPQKERELLCDVSDAVALECGSFDQPQIEESSAGPVLFLEFNGWRFRLAMVSLEKV